jgi:putative peptidoglycan lipid II flippase
MSQLRSISRLTFINFCTTGVTVVDSIVQAQFFGVSVPMRDYLIAITLLTTVQKLFMVGQFSDVFLPQYIKIRETEGLEKADRCFSALYNHIMLSLVVAGVVLALAAPLLARLIAPGFSPEAQHDVAWLSIGLIPTLLMVVANGHLQIIGNARGWYGRFEFYGFLGNALGLAGMVATAKLLGVWSVVLSQNLTQLVMLLCSFRYLARNGYRHAWIWSEPGFKVADVIRRVGLTVIYVGVTQWYVIAFNRALTFLPGSALAVYKYAESLYIKTGSQFMRPVSVVFFTDASVLAQRDPARLRLRLSHALYHYALMYVGVLGVLFLAVPNVLGALWGGPHYNAADIAQTTFYVCCLFALLLVDAVGLIYRRINMVVGDLVRQYMVMSVVQAGMAVAAPWIVGWLQVDGAPTMQALNVTGLALSAVVVQARHRYQHLAFFPAHTWKLLATIILPLTLAWFLPHWLPWLQYAGDYSVKGKIMEIIKGALMGGLGLGLVISAMMLLKVEEAHAAWRWLRMFLAQAWNGAKVTP